MAKEIAVPETLQQAIIYFADEDNAHAFMCAIRWPEGPQCFFCGSFNVRQLSTRRVFRCKAKGCRKDFTAKRGTIFEDSPISLGKWFTAIWLVANCKNGISSYELARDLGVCQKTAWFMLHRARLAMQEHGGGLLAGEIEVDETYIGGKARNMHAAKRDAKITAHGVKGKAAVFGMVERGGKVRATHVEKTRKEDLQARIRESVEAGAAIFSDQHPLYAGLDDDYKHAVINHAIEYVNGNTHTNTIENFWSLLKRGLHGTYVAVEPFHLFRYIDEQAFRYNNRKTDDATRFEMALSQAPGRRLTFTELTGKSEGEPPESVN
jgi:transposase-like protein